MTWYDCLTLCVPKSTWCDTSGHGVYIKVECTSLTEGQSDSQTSKEVPMVGQRRRRSVKAAVVEDAARKESALALLAQA